MNPTSSINADASGFLDGRSEMATLIRERDWSLTPLGPIASWPQSLKTTVSLCLASNFPINIIWGPERNQIYNDGYRVLCGEAHPRSLGEDYRVTWESAWPALSAPFDQSVAGSTSYLENQRMFLSRNGYLEETFFTFSLSPIRDESGGIGGLFHPVTETTPTILSERRTRALRDVNARLGLAKDMAELGTAIVETLGQFEFDLPCVFVYATDGHGYHPLAANGLETDPREMPWPFAAAAASGQLVEVEDLEPIIRDRRCGPYEEGPARGVLLPITIMGSAEPPMMVALGVSPRLPYDESYRGFLDLLGSTITAALRTVRAREDERRRLETLAEIDRAKTTFFSNVSHEFRTPLTLMLAPLEETLAKPGDLAGDIRDRIELAHRNAVRLLKLVNTLLDFSRMETGRTDASFQKTDIAAYTVDLASNFRSVIETAGLDFVVEAEPVSEQVYLDRDMFEKIVLNLLSNAFKFTHEGEIRVQVRGDTEANSVHIVVSDTGIGIAEQEVPRLFDRFHRVAGAKGRSFEGSGIGLSLVRELVDAHGGTIDVASMPGMGTTFTISIPMGMHHLPADRIKEGPAASAASSKAGPFIDEALGWLPDADEVMPERDIPEAKPKLIGHVLLADDNADMRRYVARLLRSEGLTVDAVPDGLQALRQARKARPDLIISDVMMPDLDGFQLLKAVRDDDGLKTVPIMLLSARAGVEAQAEGLEAGADDYLIKPFSGRELIARVSASLINGRQRTEASLVAMNELLEQRVADKTRELEEAHDKLRQSQKMEAIGTLTGGIAHDFNNLLTPIIGALDMIQRRDVGDERVRRMVSGAMQSSERARVLIQRLLAFARRQPLQSTDVDIGMLIKGMADIIESTTGSRTKVAIEVAANLRRATVDTNQLEMAILNLAVNARDAMPEGGILRISAANAVVGNGAEIPAGNYVNISVTDTGSGMDAETVKQATEPFFSTKGVGRGSGLGLSMVHGLVTQLGGRLSITSKVSVGTTVDLWLPSADVREETAADNEKAALGAGAVLIVDDEPLVLMNTSDILTEFGFQVHEASSADDALELMRKGLVPDLLITDHMMPGKSGAELAREVRANHPDLPILIVSGYAAADIGAFEFPRVGKPFRQSELAKALERLLPVDLTAFR